MAWKRSSRRNKQRSETIEFKTFLGQQFAVASHKNGTYRLVGAAGTQLEGVIFDNVSNKALARFRDDSKTNVFDVKRIILDL